MAAVALAGGATAAEGTEDVGVLDLVPVVRGAWPLLRTGPDSDISSCGTLGPNTDRGRLEARVSPPREAADRSGWVGR